MKTKEDFNKEMQELSYRLGNWSNIKKAGLAIQGKKPEDRSEKEIKLLKKYEKLKPIREQVRELKAERDKLFRPKPKKEIPKYLKVLKNKGNSLVFQVEDKQLEIDKMFIEDFRRVIYQVPETAISLIQKHGIDRTGQDLNARPFTTHLSFKSGVLEGQHARKK